jgi:methylated-DNA-[protein]-cysteine S-methyltransferase
MNVGYYHELASPIGTLLLVSNGKALTGLYMADHQGGPQPNAGWLRDERIFDGVCSELAAYFDGTLHDFSLALEPHGTTFQKRVWNELRRIPYGETISYGELARRIGQPNASRAVGRANGQNPISIVIPCHRVIGADGTLTGYGGGLDRKQRLLELERATLYSRT